MFIAMFIFSDYNLKCFINLKRIIDNFGLLNFVAIKRMT